MKSTTATVASLALLAQAAPVLASPVPATSAPHSPEAARQHLNTASRQAMQYSWMHIPPMCKDRSFAFEPVQVGTETADAATLSLFQQLDARAEIA